MAVKTGISIDPVYIPNADGEILAVPTGVTRRVITAAAVQCNAGCTVTIYRLNSGGTSTTLTRIYQKALSAGDSEPVINLIGQSLEVGGTLRADDGASGGTDVTIHFTVTDYNNNS